MAIAVEEVVTGGMTTGDSYTLTSWTPGSNELVIVAVGMRNKNYDPTPSGNGLTFVEVAVVENVQGQNQISVFRAMGASPSTGQITITASGNNKPSSGVAFRLSGVDTSGTNGSGAVEAYATDTGPDPDDDDMMTDITTITDGAWAVGCGTHRARTFTVPGGETSISINNFYGSGGDVTSCSNWYESVPSATTVTVGAAADLDSDVDWCMVALSIKPAGAAGISIPVVMHHRRQQGMS